jgi:maleylacetate reductase
MTRTGGESSASLAFRFRPHPMRVIFGAGKLASLGEAVKDLGGARAFVLSSPGQKKLAALAVGHLGATAVGQFNGAVMHTPVMVTETALQELGRLEADCIVAVGGGSTIGLAKALALRTDLPQVVVPTTYAGSEMTDILGETSDGAKTTQRSPRILPETVIYDVELTLGLPPLVSATSGMNAIAHAVEALYAADTNPAIAAMAAEGITSLARSLPLIMLDQGDVPGREDALAGAWLCGICLANTAMALHHKICHVLGGTFGLPHAETHTVMLPHTVAYNAGAAPAAMTVIADALGADDAVQGLKALKHGLVGDMSLASLGLPREALETAARAAIANPYANPRAIAYEPILAMLRDAY